MLGGNYLTLRALYDTLHEVSKKTPRSLDPHEVLLMLAYDVRKAYSGQHTTIKPTEHFPEIGPRFGVKILWPMLLYQCSVLRESLKFFDSTKSQQAMTFMLEQVVTDGLHADFKADALAIIDQWERLGGCLHGPQERVLTGVSMFCSWSKKDRRVKLECLLKAFVPSYDILYPHFRREGVKNLIDPEEFETFCELDESINPRW